MSEIFEEHASKEVIKRDEAFEVLQKELDRVEEEKKQLAIEVVGLRVAHQTVEDLKIQVGALEKDVASSKVAEEMALAQLQKAINMNEGLQKEVDAEKSLCQAQSAQIDLLNKRLEEAWIAGVSATELYRMALASFGGATSPLPADASAYAILAWFEENVVKLSEFVGGAMDFGALSCATNLCKTLGKLGCMHFVGLKGRREFKCLRNLVKLWGKLPSRSKIL